MIKFLKSLTPKTRILLAFILGGIVILFFGITLVGFLSARRSMEKVNQYDVAIGLARQTDADFQLSISKGKNFAILKDETNRALALEYFKKAQDTFVQLSKAEGDPVGKNLLFRIGAGLHNVEFSLGILISTAKKSDSAEKLYSKYLKDITIDFDNASQAYVDYLEEKIHSAQSDSISETQSDLFFAFAGALLALVGMGISYSIANSLNQALQNETSLEERYRVLTEITEESIMIHDQGIVVDVNPALARLLGYEIPEIIGRHISEFSDSSSARMTEEYLKRGYPKGSYEITGIRKNGTAFPLLVHGHDLVYKGRKLRASSGWDLTEWKKAEKAILENQERFKRFAEVTKEGILIHENGIVIDINQALLDMVGLTFADLVGTDGTSVLSVKSAEQIRKFRKEGYPNDPYEIVLRHKDGTLFPAEVHGRNFSFEGKRLRVASFWNITERKKAEKALFESENRFKRFAEISKEGIFINEEEKIIDLNSTLAHMLGYELKEIIGTEAIGYVTPETTHIARTKLKEKSDEPYEIELRRKNGTVFPAEIHDRNYSLGGKSIRVTSVWNVTERKAAEEALRESKDRFQRLAEVTQEGIMIHDRGTVVDVNPALASMLGYPISEMLGKEKFSFLASESIEIVRKHVEDNYRQPYEITAQRKDGSTFPAEIIGQNFRHNGKELRVASIWDITERKKAEEALRQSESKFRGLIENSYDLITLLDPQGRRLYESPSMERILGYKPGERKGVTFDTQPPEDQEKARKVFAEVLANPGVPYKVELRARHKDGHLINAEMVLTNLLNDPAVGGIVVNGRDVTAKVKAEEALRKSEEHFRSLIEKSHDVISLLQPDGVTHYVSPSIKEALGYDPSERIGRPFHEIVHPEDLEGIQSFLKYLSRNPNITVTSEARVRHKDGRWRHVEGSATNLLDNPDIGAIVLNYRDITEKVEAEKERRQSEENFRNLIEKAPDAVLVSQGEKIVYVNPKILYLLGYDDKEELLGRSGITIVHPEDQKAVGQRIEALIRGGRTYPTEIRLVRRDGVEMHVEASSIGIQFEGKSAIMVIFRDLTSRKQAEAIARENQERYRSLVESMPDAVMVHDEENILFVNPAALKMFGAGNEDELLGKSFWIIVPPEFQETVRTRLKATIERGSFNEPAERKLRRLDQSVIDVLVTSGPFSDRGRRVVLAIFSDITARKEAERKAHRYQRLAALGELAAGMAHEIRNPTAAISAQAQYLLKKTEDGSTSLEQLKDIIQQCDRLDTLVHDTLDYSPERKFEERTEIPAKDLLQKALWLAQTQFGPSHARVQVELDLPPNLPTLKVHPTRMERVLVNLILNAFQAMPNGGKLLLRADDREKHMILRVEDNGKGITDAEMARLFEPFFTSRKMGSGLGLAICQKIVEEHQGQIRVERVEPHGAAFIVDLPLPKENRL